MNERKFSIRIHNVSKCQTPSSEPVIIRHALHAIHAMPLCIYSMIRQIPFRPHRKPPSQVRTSPYPAPHPLPNTAHADANTMHRTKLHPHHPQHHHLPSRHHNQLYQPLPPSQHYPGSQARKSHERLFSQHANHHHHHRYPALRSRP